MTQQRRALVSVIRHAGDENISRAIIYGTVSREIRMMQAERDLLACRRRDDVAQKIAEARVKYAIRRESPILTAYCRVAAFFILLAQWIREDDHAGSGTAYGSGLGD